MGRLDLIILAAAAAAAQKYTGAATVIHHASISNAMQLPLCEACCKSHVPGASSPSVTSTLPVRLGYARSASAIRVGDHGDYLRVTNTSYGRRPLFTSASLTANR